MERLIDSYENGGNLHHAYLLVGNKEVIFPKLKNFLEKNVGFKTSGNPDFWYRQFKTFTIEDARQVADTEKRKSFAKDLTSGILKVFVIETEIITTEAQSAMLKVFEEPTTGTHFFIISPQDIFLPTLRSRMQVLQFENLKQSNIKPESILSLKLGERLLKVKEITEAISDEEKTKQDAVAFLNEIEKELYLKGVEEFSNSLKICQNARTSLYDRGAPVKIILENLVISI